MSLVAKLSPDLEHDDSYIVMRARLRPLPPAEIPTERVNGEGEQTENRYWFTAEISNESLDSYFTHMSSSTLRNFARDAAEGVSLLDSHDGRKLGVGYSAGGRFEEENGVSRALGIFYIVRGLKFGGRHSYASTDDLIYAIENEVVRDVSVGFYGGRWICDLCHQPYYGYGTACNHWAGVEYEIEVDGRLSREICTVTIEDARLSEVSLVFDGATPGAMILKAEAAAEAGTLSADVSRFLEAQYRVKLPVRAPNQLTVTTGNAAGVMISADETNGERTMTLEEETIIEETVDVETNSATAESDEVAKAERALLTNVCQAAAESPAPRDVTPAEAVRWLSEQLAQVTQERDAARQEVTRLQPLADQGRAYRAHLIEEAVAEGVRAMGEAFPEETYRAMLADASLEHIEQMRDAFGAKAAERFPGGRQTHEEPEKAPVRNTVPLAAYGAIR